MWDESPKGERQMSNLEMIREVVKKQDMNDMSWNSVEGWLTAAEKDYKALKESRAKLFKLTKDVLCSIQNSRKGSVGSMDNVYVCQLGVERIDKLAEALKESK